VTNKPHVSQAPKLSGGCSTDHGYYTPAVVVVEFGCLSFRLCRDCGQSLAWALQVHAGMNTALKQGGKLK